MNQVWYKALCFCAGALLLGLPGCAATAGSSGSSGNSGQNSDASTKISEETGIKKDATILFMGDSITDGGRTDYSVKTYMGGNHPKLVSDYMKKRFTDENFTFYNTGVSGDTVLDQYFRLQEDCYDLQPDYIILLLGVNDSWNGYKGAEVFEKSYRLLIEGIKANTSADLIIVEPFLLDPNDTMQKACVIADVGSYIPTVLEMAGVIRSLASEYALKLIPLASVLEQKHQGGMSYQMMASDAIHPTGITSGIFMDLILLQLGINGYEAKYGPYDE